MTIKEKLCEPLGKFYTETSKELEQIADDYAIFFAEWCANKYVKLHSVWCPIFGDQRDKNNWRTTKELLEIFKKEKGL